MDLTPNFEPCQIVCLEHNYQYLYAEIIQVITSRHKVWVRPLILKQDGENDCQFWNLQEGADLVWPLELFRLAFDTEVIPLLTQLSSPTLEKLDHQLAHQHLRAFVDQVWQAYPQAFAGVCPPT